MGLLCAVTLRACARNPFTYCLLTGYTERPFFIPVKPDNDLRAHTWMFNYIDFMLGAER
jgi:hypothetical protein